MPTYSYACKSCGHAFDAVQSFTDASLTVCPVCGGALHKHYGSIGVTFRGSGFYRTDSRKSQVATGGSSGTPTTSSASSKTEATSSPAAAGK